MIPLVDLKKQYLSIKKEIDGAIQKVINDSAFILGKYTSEFEKNFADYCDAKFCAGLNSGTDGLFLSFLAIGLKAGDEVITVSNTFFATTEYLGHIGVKPVFVDIDPETYLMDASKLESAITTKTKAIIPVHLYGQMADMETIMSIAKRYDLKVIEDCAQAHGAEQSGKKAGTFGDLGIYSFYPGKNLGAYGDAGCIITNNKQYDEFIRIYRDHGRRDKYEHIHEGYNSRMDGLQAAILNVKLKYLDAWIDKRRQIAAKYNSLLKDEIKIPIENKGNKHSYHLYVIRTKKRDALIENLKKIGVQAGIHYPIPLHLQEAYFYLGLCEGSFPISELVAKEIISLPIYPELSDEEIDTISEIILAFKK